MPATNLALTGNEITLYVYVGGVPQPIAYQTEHSHESSREGIDQSHKGSDHTVTSPGREEGTISLSLRRLDPRTPVATHTTLRDAYNNKTPVIIQEVVHPNGSPANGSQDEIREAEGYILSYSSESPDNDSATYELEVTLNEALRPAAAVARVAASLNIGAGNAGVRYVANTPGPDGNRIRVAHVAAAGAAAATTVAVASGNPLGGSDITVTLGTGASAGVVNATAAQVVAAVNGNVAAAALVDAFNLGDGTGIAVAQAMTALAAGT